MVHGVGLRMEIRESVESDEKGIRELFEICFGREMSHDEWVWKYRQSPWESSATIALDRGKIVAHYGGLKMRFYFKGEIFDAYQPCDVMTHPEYRAKPFSRKGLIVRTAELFYTMNTMDFAVGFPSERHAILGTKQLGYTKHNYVTILNKKISRLKPARFPLLKVETVWSAVGRQELDALWGRVRNNCGLSIKKKSDYIFWRYRDNPVKKYEPLIVRGRYGRDLKAFGVFSIKEDVLIILDFFCVKGIKTEAFLNLFEIMAIKNGLHGIKLWVNPNEDMFQIIVGQGYEPEKGIPYIFKVLNEGINSSFLFDNYYYRMGDYDDS